MENAETRASDFVIFSKNSFDQRLGDFEDPWTRATIEMLTRKVGVFVGLSTDGPNFGPAMQQVKKRIDESRPTGFWFVATNDTEQIQQLRDWRAIPIIYKDKDYAAIPELLFEVCQMALKYT